MTNQYMLIICQIYFLNRNGCKVRWLPKKKEKKKNKKAYLIPEPVGFHICERLTSFIFLPISIENFMIWHEYSIHMIFLQLSYKPLENMGG